ncbi:MAG: sigma-54 dependent transcriptional regulator [Proteobacteria bacterium]|nr:sigma-54 dependent transcriptional regulator [Pseudomonadota bacterium]MBU4382141.1 sigma-54 dependent transcriptional regulator [Pseudomonadota bacterium]MCG2763017.1 sigma-54 dependent transcriptional regulator [Desulfarculaceae bacterium]
MSHKPKLLIVEDDALARKNLQHILEHGGEYQVTAASGGAEALQLFAKKSYDLVLTDLRMEKIDGMQVLEEVKRASPATEVIMLTAFASVDSAIQAMKRGAFHYIAKPYKIDEVRAQVAHALEKARLTREVETLKQDLRARDGADNIVGNHPRIQELIRVVAQVAPSDSSVLIVGETGTGKELFARALHHASHRADNRFVAFNCAAFAQELLVSELFGHEKGSFTGAHAAKPGLFEAANGGTVLLDEIGDMPKAMQVKLLRVIQEKELTRVGGTEPIPVDVRIVAATHRDLASLVEQGVFRSDLYYRINVVRLELPPLRWHRDDIPLLANHFLHKHAERQGKDTSELSQEAMEVLMAYEFPGNVRELENIIERAVTLRAGGRLELADLPEEVKAAVNAAGQKDGKGRLPTLEEKECEYIKHVLDHTGGNKTRAAEILSIDRVSLWRKIKKFGLEP